MRQYDLFGNIVDTKDEREQAYQLDLELTDLYKSMRNDFDNKKFNPYLEERKRHLSYVDFLNIAGCLIETIGCKNTKEIEDVFKTEIYNYNKLFDIYVNWKIGGYEQ